ncbi:MFS transporter [Glutamicibacter uratoxydans]|uniref:MFS transporter n=1 Tax=Glutamicibacter uratoxydans TaxID=43667 RepID=A0A4Y4DK36_GLUUR|nr:MFS transporter [Glutamicibacter uratoxydans]GED04987.1 MFS transporter [Glutamicibacter uratoxydans]
MTMTAKAKWGRFALLVMGGGTIYKLANLKDVFYVPMQDHLGLTNTEIGLLLSVNSIVATALFVVGGFLADRFRTRTVISAGLIGAGLLGLYMSTFPTFSVLTVIFALLAVCSDCLFWPALLKSVRQLGGKEEQGRMFGFLEGGRGIVDTIVAFSALGIFVLLGSGIAGFRAAIITYAVIDIAIGILLFFLLRDSSETPSVEATEAKQDKLKVFEAFKIVAKLPQLWLVSLTVFMVYIVYVGLTYFIPFLSDVYGLPTALVGVFGIINQYGLKILGGPMGGFLADKKFKSSSRYIGFSFLALLPVMAVIILLPKTSNFTVAAMIMCLLFSVIVFSMRGVFWAPMDEVGIPEEISGTAFGIASLIGYAPGMFGFLIYGAILDANPGTTGYYTVFMIMCALAVIGSGVAFTVARMARRKKTATMAA